MDNQVVLRKDYFARTAIDSYVDWQSAFVREFFQNSVDANSSNIRFCNDKKDFSIFDDGCGMDKHTVQNILLELLGTTKGENDVGGKGRAKEILFFAWPEWRIKTRNLVVNGSFINYSIEETDLPVSGTEIRVKLDREADLRKAFLEYAKKCSFSQDVKWNEEPVTGMGRLEDLILIEEKRILNTSSTNSDDAFMTIGVYHHPQKDAREVYIRSNGLFMFSKPFRTDRGLIIEIPKGLSKIMLTGNRDDFLSFYKDHFDVILLYLSSMDEKGNVSASRSLHNQDYDDELDNATLMRRLGYVLEASPKYGVSVKDVFYDHNLSGRDVLIELETPQTEAVDDIKHSYGYLIGTDARLEEDEIRFERIYLGEDPVMKRAFNLADVVLSARAEFKRKDLGPGVIDFSWPYEGSLIVDGYKIQE